MTSETYARALCKIVVVQLVEQVGFHAIHNSATETLADILRRYIEEVGTVATSFSELAGRTECNFYDVSQALKKLGTSTKDINSWTDQFDDLQFARQLTPFPKPVKVKDLAELRPDPELPMPEYIPNYLPLFPPKHTYIHTPVQEERKDDIITTRKLKSKGKRQVEESLTKLKLVVKDQVQTSVNLNNIYLKPPQPTLKLITPTPTPIPPTIVEKVLPDSLEEEEPEKFVTRTDTLEDSERVKKRQKCEKILSLDHSAGMEHIEGTGVDENSTMEDDANKGKVEEDGEDDETSVMDTM